MHMLRICVCLPYADARHMDRLSLCLVLSFSAEIRKKLKLETLVSYLKDVGIAQFDVDASNYSPESQNRNTRPDRSAALKRAHEAVAYDAWFREQVQAPLMIPDRLCPMRKQGSALPRERMPCVRGPDASGMETNGPDGQGKYPGLYQPG